MDHAFTCPHCGRDQIAVSQKATAVTHYIDIGSTSLGSLGLHLVAFCCSNNSCNQPVIETSVVRHKEGPYGYFFDTNDIAVRYQRIYPESFAQPQPDIIPIAIREDYYEACRIRDLSPKASATLSRRCLQGMIRDFCKIAEATLFQEIKQLRKLVDEDNAPKGVTPESIDAIDSVRAVGNIGAHMEKNVDHIVPVEPDEAQILLDLIESLFDEWYVAAHQREQRFAKVKSLASEKKIVIEELRSKSSGPNNDGGAA
jgi:hypothetical protein